MVQNRQVVAASRPTNEPQEENYKIASTEIDLEGNTLAEGEILVKTYYVSVDPYLRIQIGYVSDGPGGRPSKYPNLTQFKDGDAIAPFGGLLGGRCAGVVLKSKNPKIAPGDLVGADWKWTEYAIFNPDKELTFEKIDKELFTAESEPGKLPISTTLGMLGVSGSNAYFGYKALELKPGQTLVVSSAAGNIGVIASQLGKVNGVKTVGIAGGNKAKQLVDKNVCDAGIDYRAFNGDVAALSKAIKEACPNGVDGYYDNTRGFISEAVYENLNPGAHIYIGGGVSEYNNGKPMSPYTNVPRKEGTTLILGGDRMQHYLTHIPEARAELAKLILAGKMNYFEHVTNGFENIPKAFVGMYKGENFGKAIVKV